MKSGGTVPDVLRQVQAIEAGKRDFLVPEQLLDVVVDETEVKLAVENAKGDNVHLMRVRPRAHSQIAQELGIPQAYYDRMLTDAPDLLARNVKEWLTRRPEGNRRLLRTVEGGAYGGKDGMVLRAYLSDRYRPLDNYDLAEAVLPEITGENVRIESIGLTEDRFYLKAVNPKVSGEVRVGDEVQAGVIVSNSEVGAGSLKVEPFIYTLICKNGAVRDQLAARKYHVGRRQASEDAAFQFFTDETRKADDKAFFLRMRDTVRAAFDMAFFKKGLEEMKRAAGIPVEMEAADVIELLSENLRESERGRVLEAYIQGNDRTVYGVANAVTLASQDVESYDRATELERLGGLILSGDVRLNK